MSGGNPDMVAVLRFESERERRGGRSTFDYIWTSKGEEGKRGLVNALTPNEYEAGLHTDLQWA